MLQAIAVLRPIGAALVFLSLSAGAVTAQTSPVDEEEYKAKLPDVSIYKAMLDAGQATGWVQFRNYDGKQILYFTGLQTMHCRLSEIRYSINSIDLDQRFPLAACNPQLPFSLPDKDIETYVYLTLPAGTAASVAVQAVWDDGAGSEIVVYKPCTDVGDATCAAISTINKPRLKAPAPETVDALGREDDDKGAALVKGPIPPSEAPRLAE